MERARPAEQTVQRFLLAARQVSRHPSEECVHQLRTNSRRIQSLLMLYPGLQGRSAKRLGKQLRKLRRAAGAVRDLDVQSEWLRQSDVEAEAILKWFARKRRRAAARLAEVTGEELAGGMRRRLLRLRGALATAEPVSESALVEAVMERATHIAWDYRSVDAGNLHQFRIECKRIRYMAEPAAGRGIPPAMVKAIRRAQDEIGAWHDWCTLAATVAAHKHTTADLDEAMRRNEQEHQAKALKAAADARQALESFVAARVRSRAGKGGPR